MSDAPATCNTCRHCRKAILRDAGWIPNRVFGTCFHADTKGAHFVYRIVPLGASCPMHEPGDPVPIPEPKPVPVKPTPWWHFPAPEPGATKPKRWWPWGASNE